VDEREQRARSAVPRNPNWEAISFGFAKTTISLAQCGRLRKYVVRPVILELGQCALDNLIGGSLFSAGS
jgi:hypothetical protein